MSYRIWVYLGLLLLALAVLIVDQREKRNAAVPQAANGGEPPAAGAGPSR